MALPTMEEVLSRKQANASGKSKLPTMEEVLSRSPKPKKTFLQALTTWPHTEPLDPKNPADAAELRNRMEGTATSGIGKFVERTGQAGVEAMFLNRNPYKTTTGNKVADIAADLTGGALGLINPQSGLNAGASLFKLPAMAAERVAPKIAKVAPRAGKALARVANPKTIKGAAAAGAASMVPFTAVESVVNNEKPTGDQILLNAGLGVLLGAGGKAVAPVLEKGASKVGRLLEGLTGKKVKPSKPAAEASIQQPVPNVATATATPDSTTPVQRQPFPKLKAKPVEQQALDDLQEGIEAAQNYIGHNDVLAAYPPGTSVEAAFADIKKNTGVDLPLLVNNLEKAQQAPKLREQLMADQERTRLAQTAGVLPQVTGIKRGANIQARPIARGEKPILPPLGSMEPSPMTPDMEARANPGPLTPRKIAPPEAPMAPSNVVAPIVPLTPTAPLTPLQKVFSDAKVKTIAADGTKQRGFVDTLQESAKPTEEIKQGLLSDLRSRYTPISNQETVARANKRVAKDIEEAANYVSSARKYTPEHVATAHRLIDEFQKMGQVSRAVDVAEKLAEQGTKAGQSIQAFSIYNRLSPEGILVHASRIVAKANERITIGAEPVKLTEEIAAKLTDLSTTMQTMNAVKDKANSVIDIVARARTGEKLTDAETVAIKEFINEASRFVGKVKPFKPKPVVEVAPRIRDNVVKFFDKQEQDALKRIMERKNRVSSTPLDMYGDYVIVGSSRLAKGVVKFSDWAESMVRDLGEEVRPHLEDIYNKAVDKFNLSAKAISHGKLSEVERITNRAIKNQQIAPEEAEALRKIAEQVAGLSGEARIAASQDLQAILQAFERPTIGTKVATAQTIAQLLNPKTTVRNALGNELFYRFERLNKMVAAPIDWARVKLTGGQMAVSFIANSPLQGEYWKNWLTGWRAGLRGVNPEGLTTQYDLRPQTFSNKWNPLNYLEKVTGATLKSFDYAAYKRAVGDTLNEMAHLDALRLGLKGEVAKEHIGQFVRAADENVLAIADQYGKYVTFQDNNILSLGMVKLKRGLNFGRNFGFGDLILKYPKTPANLLMRAIEYSPAGFLRSVYILAGPLFKAQPNTAEVINSLSRAIIGTVGLTGLGYFLADKGILTGTKAKDKDVRELQTAAGQGQYRVNVTALQRWALSGFNPSLVDPQENDTLVSYDWAQPVAVSLSIGANALTEQRTAKNSMSGLYNVAQGGLNTLTEQSLLQGLQRAFETYPGREGVLDKAVDIGVTLPASFVPTLVSQVNQMTDNAKRLISPVPPKEEAVNLAKTKVPGLARDLPIDYTTLGKPKEKFQGGSNNLFNVFLNPSFVSKYKPSPEAKLVIDLMNRTGDTMVAPRRPSSSIVIDGERRKLSLEQLSRLQLLVGQETAKRLRGIDAKLSDERKTKAILRALDVAGQKGRGLLKKEIKESR